ncbi:hypothetical protein [Prosthecobacter sp.]|uniref:hypothetical protein n=1 Tax=Prosthecobacter sp. TaxID=1965333 RepID=UPI003783B67B
MLRRAFLCLLLPFVASAPLHAQQGTAVSARFASIKGVVMISTPGGGTKEVHKGDTVRSGTIIECGAGAGASLKPLPTLHIIVYPDTKVRFDGADVNGDGGGSVMCTIIAGKALFHIDQPPQGPGDSKPAVPVIKVTVVTDEGVIVNNVGGKPGQSEAGTPDDKAGSRQITAATWTVQHDEGRTVVAVSEGLSNVSIGKGAAAGSGEVGGQVKVPQGSVIWLFNRDGKISAELVDTNTGKVTNLTGGPSSGNSLVEQSKNQLVSPSSGGTTSTPGSTPGTPGTLPNNPSSNPDLSTPQKPLPVVSADTP